MPRAGSVGDWESQAELFDMTCAIVDPSVRADTLNQLLVMRGHELHQEVTREIQLGRYPSSVPFIRQMLESRFAILDYHYSEQQVIAKWFSHALADINTPEAIQMIDEFSESEDPGIASEMKYRLSQLAAQRAKRR